LHVAHQQGGYSILDVSDPVNPSLVSNYDPGFVLGLTVYRNLCHLRLYGGSFEIVDISNPYSLQPIDTYLSSGSITHVSALEQYLLLSTDSWLAAYRHNYPPPCCSGIRGNVDNDDGHQVDISDLIYLVDYMFEDGPAPPCFNEADVDASGSLDIGDLVYLVDYMFSSGPEPLGCY
jgi:hypothetical protein